MSLRVVIADDSLIVRAGLARLLEAEGCPVVAEAGDEQTLLRAIARDTIHAGHRSCIGCVRGFELWQR